MPNLFRSVIWIAVSVFIAANLNNAASADDKTGVILMHGKRGAASPRSPIGKLAQSLADAGFIVIAPDMPWSKSRIWDKNFDESMVEIDGYVEELKGKGVKKIVVGGHSIGANAAIGYGARRKGLSGILAIAPGHVPDIAVFQRRMENDYERAKKLVDAGKGEQRGDFNDSNQGRVLAVNAKAKDYLSWYDPSGPAVMPRNAANLKPNTPLMWIIGEKDTMLRFGRDESYAFNLAPAHPKNSYVVVRGGHRVTPQKGEGEIIQWLKGL